MRKHLDAPTEGTRAVISPLHQQDETQFMTVKREAAFHEAGHAVVAYFSKFHRVVGPINLAQYGSGEIFVALSKGKVTAAGKQIDESLSRQPDVAVDLAIVLCAGLVCERLAEEREADIKSNADCAMPDHELMRQVLQSANLSKKFDCHELKSKQLLDQHWSLVVELADALYSARSMDALSIEEFIDARV